MLSLGILVITVLGIFEQSGCAALERRWEISEVCPVGPVWSGHPVGFSLLTVPPYQYVGFYNAERTLVVGMRILPSRQWKFRELPSVVGWDSHNEIVMVVDQAGCLHVSGNMHVTPLIYFRMERPHDLASLAPIHRMVGENETRVTYPRFITMPTGEIVFFYRDGSSGRGRQFFNLYDLESRAWRRLFEAPLLDGGEQMSAYPSGPVLGPDGWWHLCWVWRDTPDCSTNHDVCYARSPDLVRWETVDGKLLSLPITPSTSGVVVDPVPAKGGLINVGHHVGFDSKFRPIVTYQKYDADGNSQIFNARWEGDRWVIRQTSDWSYRWEFSGGGTIGAEIVPGPVEVVRQGMLIQKFTHKKYGRGVWILDEDSLRPVATCSGLTQVPLELLNVESDFFGLEVRLVWGAGSGINGERYLLRWETLPPNRDRPRQEPLPPPSTLRVYGLRPATL